MLLQYQLFSIIIPVKDINHMINTLKKFTWVIISLLAVAGCKKQPDEELPKYIQTANVYVAGSAYDANGVSQAVYWKNNTLVALTSGANGGSAAGIAVSGNDIYVSGSVGNANGNSVATVWKNGVPTSLAPSNTPSGAGQIIVQGNDVYIEGFINSNAVYWKNTITVTLPLSTGNYAASGGGIAVNGSNVYVSGYQLNALTYIPSAVYWKNGVPKTLTNTSSVYGNKIAMLDTNVYITAFYSGQTKSKTDATYWKNGTPVSLADGLTQIDPTGGIAVNGTDVYVAGMAATIPYNGVNNYFEGACYWKNGVFTDLSNGMIDSYAADIAVFNNDAYVVGYTTLNGKYSKATFWKNGAPVYLDNTLAEKNCRGAAIFLTPL